MSTTPRLSPVSKQRSRDGCWTCKARKKKCDAGRPSCHTCNRMGLTCQGYQPKIVWEDADTRAGMRKRGPRRLKPDDRPQHVKSSHAVSKIPKDICEDLPSPNLIIKGQLPSCRNSCQAQNHSLDIRQTMHFHEKNFNFTEIRPTKALSSLPVTLTTAQSVLFDNYISHFSITYPTFGDSSNPFLSTFVPLALRNETVLYALLALSGIQAGSDGHNILAQEKLAMKDRALRGCQKLLKIYNNTRAHNLLADGRLTANLKDQALLDIGSLSPGTLNGENELLLLTSVILLILYDKLSGASYNEMRPHLLFAHMLFKDRTSRNPVHKVRHASGGNQPDSEFSYNQLKPEHNDTSEKFSEQYRFLYSLFLYNDLLAAIAVEGPSLSSYTMNGPENINKNCNFTSSKIGPQVEGLKGRYYFPNILSRITNGDNEITMKDIDCWDGNMTWLPSFASAKEHVMNWPAFNMKMTDSETYPSGLDSDNSPHRYEASLISGIYRCAAKVLLIQRRGIHNGGLDIPTPHAPNRAQDDQQENETIMSYTSEMIFYIKLLPEMSIFENALLWPIAIIALDLSSRIDRDYIISVLDRLEARFKLAHFRKFKENLTEVWKRNYGIEGILEEDAETLTTLKVLAIDRPYEVLLLG